MPYDITKFSPTSGRVLKENNTTVNLADILDDVYDDTNGVLKTSAAINVESLAITEVAIKDGSSTNKLKVNANGSIDANVTGVTITGVSTEAKQDTIISHVDGIEGLLTSIKDTAGIKKITDPLPAGTNNIGSFTLKDSATSNALKVNANGSIDANVTGVTITGVSTEAKQDTIITHVDGIEGLLTSIKDTDGIKKITDALPAGSNTIGNVGLVTGTNSIGTVGLNSGSNTIGNVGLVAGNNNVGKFGYTLKCTNVSFTRPADTTAYTVGDAVTNSTTAPTVFQIDLSSVGAVNGQSIEIRKIAVASSVKQATLPLFNVYLSATTFTATNDNAALAIDDTTIETGGAFIQCDTQNYTANNARVSKDNCNTPFILAAADSKIYGTLQAANAYTPVSGEKFTIIAWVALL